MSSFFDVSSWSLVTEGTITLISFDRVVFWYGGGVEYVDCTVLLLHSYIFESVLVLCTKPSRLIWFLVMPCILVFIG